MSNVQSKYFIISGSDCNWAVIPVLHCTVCSRGVDPGGLNPDPTVNKDRIGTSRKTGSESDRQYKPDTDTALKKKPYPTLENYYLIVTLVNN